MIGDQLGQPDQLSGGAVAVVVGIVGALYGGLGVGQALQNAMDSVWAVPRNNRRDPFRSRIRSLLLLVILGSVAIAAAVLSAVGRSADTFGMFGRAGIVLAAVAINRRSVWSRSASRLRAMSAICRCCPEHLRRR